MEKAIAGGAGVTGLGATETTFSVGIEVLTSDCCGGCSCSASCSISCDGGWCSYCCDGGWCSCGCGGWYTCGSGCCCCCCGGGGVNARGGSTVSICTLSMSLSACW